MSVDFRPHLLSALSRSLFTNSSQIFINSVFVARLGGKSYSDLFFLASLFSIFYYIFFAIRGEKNAYQFYKIVLILTMLGLCFFFINPLSKPVLYFFAVSVVIVDLIGTNLGPTVLQASVNPAIFRELFQKIVSLELVARISGAGLIWILSQFHLSQFYYLLGCTCLLGHLIFFSTAVQLIGTKTQKRKQACLSPEAEKENEQTAENKDKKTNQLPDLPGKGSDSSSYRPHVYINSIRSSLRFILSNSLTRIALTIMIWTHVTKFLVEYLFYQVTASQFNQASQIASFVSAITMIMIVLSLLFQRVAGKRLTERLQLSTLFSCQPINILLCGSMALLLNPFWPLVFLMVSYQCINRSIQLPVSRQCLIPVPRAQRAAIASLFSLFMAIAALLTSGIMSALKNLLHLQDFLLVLICLSSIIFFLITRLDSYYIRNLWYFYREGRSGNWTDQPFAEGLATDELLSVPAADSTTLASQTDDLRSSSILKTYLTSFDKSALKNASQTLFRLLNDSATPSLLLGMRIAFATGFPWLQEIFSRSIIHPEHRISEFADKVRKVNSELLGMSDFSSIFRKRIRALALELMESSESADAFLRLKNLLNSTNHQAAESLLAVLSNKRFIELRQGIFSCISFDQNVLSLSPMVEKMYACSYLNAQLYRELLEQLDFGKESPELANTIEEHLQAMKHDGFSPWTYSSGKASATPDLDRFMHTLFLEEYRLAKHGLDRSFTDSIAEFAILSAGEAALLLDMHLEYLKPSTLFNSWFSLIYGAKKVH